jgi:hypothetical protein
MTQLTPEVVAWLQAFSTFFALLALILSALAVYFTVRTFRLKRGAFVRGQYGMISSSIATNDPYVSEVLLENLKDRSVVIFGIYLWLDHGYYLCLEEFEGDPLIISPFEVVRRKYDPLDSYSFSMKRLKIDALLKNQRRTKIVLSTTDGMITVKKPVFINKPVYRWFKNHFIVEIRTDRMTYRGKSYGGATKYLVNLFKDNELVDTVQLYGDDQKYKWFRALGGDETDLASVDTVQQFFEKAIGNKKFKANRVEVIDYQEALNRHYKDFRYLEPMMAKRRSWFVVHVVGYLLTAWHTRRLRKDNRNRRKQHLMESEPTRAGENATDTETDDTELK